MVNIGVLVSGGGTNLQKLIDAERAGNIQNGAPEGTLLYTYSDGSTAEQPPEGYDSWPDWPAELSR